MEKQREQGGWIPVVRKRGRQGKLEAWNKKRMESLVTFFCV